MVETFLYGAGAGFCPELHIEDRFLFVDRMVLVAIRLGPDAVLLRNEDETAPSLPHERIEKVLLARGLSLIDTQTALGDIAAIQTAGIRGAWWDLWGTDPHEALGHLQRAVLGDDAEPAAAAGPVSDLSAGMTLDQLLDDAPKGSARTRR